MRPPQHWNASNPDFERVVRESFDRQAHMATLNARMTRVEPGAVDLTAPFDPRFSQQNGFWHAGAVASLADSANGYAAFTLAPPDTDVLAVEFLRVADDGRGFDAREKHTPDVHGHYGLMNMKERAAEAGGHCTIESMPGAGVQVIAEFPIVKSA